MSGDAYSERYSEKYKNLAQAVEFSFANLFNTVDSLEEFEAMLSHVKDDQQYFTGEFAYDMRSGLLYLYTDPCESSDAPGFVQLHPKLSSQMAFKKINSIKAFGMMDIFSRIILSDFCRIQSFEARESANGHTPKLFDECLKSAHFYAHSNEVDSHFIPSVMKLALISDAPLDVVKASGQCGGELFDFIRLAKRKDLMPLLDEQHRRRFLEDELSI